MDLGSVPVDESATIDLVGIEVEHETVAARPNSRGASAALAAHMVGGLQFASDEFLDDELVGLRRPAKSVKT
jgi:hypothetical protein